MVTRVTKTSTLAMLVKDQTHASQDHADGDDDVASHEGACEEPVPAGGKLAELASEGGLEVAATVVDPTEACVWTRTVHLHRDRHSKADRDRCRHKQKWIHTHDVHQGQYRCTAMVLYICIYIHMDTHTYIYI